MPLQNRVAPDGEIIATPERGTLMGNRGGCLHDEERRLGRRRWVTRQWICCVLTFKDRRRQVMAPGRYSELFFLDEATALAAGHRPCFECRRDDARRFARAWAAATGLDAAPRAADIDAALHEQRLILGDAKRVGHARIGDLPDGVILRVRSANAPCLLLGGNLLPWTPAGYLAPRPADADANATTLTPAGIIAVLKSGYRPMLHASAGISS